MNMKLAFFNGYLEEVIEQLPGHVKKTQEDKVYKLKKALYVWKQTPKTW